VATIPEANTAYTVLFILVRLNKYTVQVMKSKNKIKGIEKLALSGYEYFSYALI